MGPKYSQRHQGEVTRNQVGQDFEADRTFFVTFAPGELKRKCDDDKDELNPGRKSFTASPLELDFLNDIFTKFFAFESAI